MLPVVCVVAVKPPGPVQEYELIPAVAEKIVETLAQIVLFPVIAQDVSAFTVITTVEIAAVHGPAPSGSFVVNVRVTFPLVILGV